MPTRSSNEAPRVDAPRRRRHDGPARPARTAEAAAGDWLPDSSQPTSTLDDFRNGLADEGYYEGRNVAIAYRWAGGRYDQLPVLAVELVRDRVDVIAATGGGISGRMAKAATDTIPIVVVTGADPVAAGFTDSYRRPSSNVTGVAQLVTAVGAKRLQLLYELAPSGATLAYLENPTLRSGEETREVKAAARTLGADLSVLEASSEAEIDAVFATIDRERIGALLVGADPFFFMQRDQLVSLSQQHRVPTMYFFREFVTRGGLISYGTRLSDAYRQAGVYTGRILKGAKPADLPIVQQSERIELAVNLKLAKELGLTIPLTILVRADEVIE